LIVTSSPLAWSAAERWAWIIWLAQAVEPAAVSRVEHCRTLMT
jgi:hypothetical protein